MSEQLCFYFGIAQTAYAMEMFEKTAAFGRLIEFLGTDLGTEAVGIGLGAGAVMGAVFAYTLHITANILEIQDQ